MGKIINKKKKVAAVVLVAMAVSKYKSKKSRKYWVKPWISRRNEKSILNLIQNELRVEDPECYKNYLRMNEETFEKLLNKLTPFISKQDTVMREAVSARDKLMITLRWLATGETYRNLMFSTRVHESTISRFIPEICRHIYTVLKDDYLKMPSTPEEWSNIANKFLQYWNFPNTLGSMDGKHIAFRAPQEAGSKYYNYKGFNSIIFLAVADAEYRFLYVDVGTNGRISDGGVFMGSKICNMLERNLLNFPPDQPLPGSNIPVPHVLISDAAFPLKSYIMKPYPLRNLTKEHQIYNYRLSRARRVVENAFGILSTRFRIFLTTINLSAEKTKNITLACTALHNYLINESASYRQQCWDEPILNNALGPSIIQQSGNRASAYALQVRDEFVKYCNGEGSVPWQEDMVN